MTRRKTGVLALGALLCLSCAFGADPESSDAVSLEIRQDAGSYVLTVPVSRLLMTIPARGLVQSQNAGGAAAESSRYFYLEDRARQLIVSGWFESDAGYPGIERFWAGEMASWKRHNLPEAQAISFEKLGSWNAILYDIATPGAGNSHIRAHWVEAGTWIDIHLSLTSDRSQTERRAELRDTLQAIQVSEKPT